jgi:hypothetical protein
LVNGATPHGNAGPWTLQPQSRAKLYRHGSETRSVVVASRAQQLANKKLDSVLQGELKNAFTKKTMLYDA